MSTIQKRGHAVTDTATTMYYLNKTKLPLVVESDREDVSLDKWITTNLDLVNTELRKHGAVLFRRFSVQNVLDFENTVKAHGHPLLDYDYASTPRTVKQGKVYSSTEYPPDKVIAQHNEMSYSRIYPRFLWFYCEQPADTGGETPLADSRLIYSDLSSQLKTFFKDNELLYVRNYHPNVDLSWRTVFSTDQTSEVENFCKARSIEFHWYSPDHLQTREKSQVVIELEDGISWFNQAHLFHVSNLEPLVSSQLIKMYGEEFLPRHVYRGDGARIPDNFLEEIRNTYDRSIVQFRWLPKDVLLVDNCRVSHGRNAFTGPRKIAVAMTK